MAWHRKQADAYHQVTAFQLWAAQLSAVHIWHALSYSQAQMVAKGGFIRPPVIWWTEALLL